MPDLTRIDAAQPVELTDGSSQTAILTSSDTTGTEVALATREARIGQRTMANSIPVVVASDQSGTAYEEDTAHANSDFGAFILAVRNDGAGTTFCTDDGDYSPISVDSRGRLYVVGDFGTVTVTPSGTQTVAINHTVTTTYSGTQTVAVSNATINNFEYAEDSVHTSAHVGAFVLAVRNDSASTTFCGASGDYSPISVDNVGRVFVTGTVTSAIAQSVTIVPSGTQTVTGTVTAVPSGTFTTTYSGTQTVAVTGTVTTSAGAGASEYAEDSVHTSAHVGSFILAVRNDSVSTTFCGASGDYSPISVDNVGRVFVTGTVTSTIAQSVTIVPSGTQAVSIAASVTIVPSGTQTVTGTVTAVPSGTFTTTYSGTQTVALVSTSSGMYAEDSIHTSAHIGSFVLAVRNDSAAATFCGADGDYSPISVDNVGRQFITGTVTSTIAQSVTIVPSGTQAVSIAASVTIVPSGTQTVTGTVTAVPSGTFTTTYSGTQTVALVSTSAGMYAEDSIHTTAHVGSFILAVRNDSAAATFCNADGDYSPISVDNVGRQIVTGTVTSTIAQSVTIVPSGTQTVTGTVTAVPSGTFTTTYSGTQTVAVTGTVTTSASAGASEYAEDSVHTSAHVGTFVLAVRNDSAATTFCGADGDYSPISVDNVGRQFVTGTVTSTIAQSVTIVPSGTQAVSIAQTVTTTYSGTQTVALASTSSGIYAEDSIHTSAHVGSFVLAVRNDSAATTFCGADGDYSPISVDNVGRQFVTGTVTSTIAQSVTIVPSGTQAVSIAASVTIVPSGTQTVTGTVTAVPSGTFTVTGVTDFAEDSVHTTAHVGTFVLAVRNDSVATTFCNANGDYSPISVDNVGRVFVTGTVTSTIAQSVTIVPSGTQTVTGTVTAVPSGTFTVTGVTDFAEDSVHTSAHVGTFVLAVRNDSASTTFCSGTGDYSPISVDNVGRIFVTGTVTSTIAQSVTIVPSGTQTVTGTVTAVPSGTFTVTGVTDFAEDSVHTSAHVGTFVLAVRNDSAATTFCSGTGDYSPISVDNVGRIFVTGTVTNVPSGTHTCVVAGDIAHDGVDSGNPIKIGGKVSTTIPTPVASADRVNGWFDEYGRQVVSDMDFEIGVTSGTTGLRDRLIAQRCTILSDSLADSIAGFWTQSTAGGGTITSTSGEGLFSTSTGTTGSAQVVSTNVVCNPGQVVWMNSNVRFGDTGTAGNIRRIGMFTVSGTTPQDGFYYELTGTTLNAVYVKAASATAVASGSWSRNSVAPFTLDTNYHSFEIRYTGTTVWFYIDNVLRHSVSATTSALTAVLSLPITVTNVKTSGASNITLAVRNIANGRFGEPGGTVNETGLSAVEARAVGGGTPHDSVDSGNPLKIGGVALTANPTAVATGDRVNAMFDTLGKQVVLQGSMPDLYADGRVELTTTTSTAVISAGGAGVRTMLTHIAISNANTSAVTVSILDGSTQKWTFYVAGGGGGAVIDLNVPVRGTVTTAWNAQVNTASWTAASGSGVYVTAAGYRAV